MLYSTIYDALIDDNRVNRKAVALKRVETFLVFLAMFAFFNAMMPAMFGQKQELTQQKVDAYFTQPHKLSILGDGEKKPKEHKYTGLIKKIGTK